MLTRHSIPVTAVVAAWALALSAATPQQNPSGSGQRRQRIGVALGGGAALGLAHIGVLKWFEERHIPVDFVAGTSMGGLVGGLYATGHSAAEMSEFTRRIDWESVLRLTPEYRDLTYRRKEDRRAFPNQLELGFRKGINLPPGLSTGHGVGIVLSRFTSPYEHLDSFDDLPIPFRCVATDLLKGDPVVFQSGSLFDALRSTMAIPGVFTPWHTGGRTLVDGGTLNNVPVNVVRAMGADIVIAVVLEGTQKGDKDVQTILGVAGQSISVMIADNEKRSLALADIVVTPKLSGFESTDYVRVKELEVKGYEAAVVASSQLEKLALTEEAWAAHLKLRRDRRRVETIHPQFVRVTGTSDAYKALLEKQLTTPPDAAFDAAELEPELNHISGMGRYASAHYSFVKENGRDGLVVDVVEKTYSPPKLDTGILIDAANGQNVRFGVGGRLTFLDFGGLGSEWRTDLSFGGINSIVSEYYWRVKGSRFFVAPRGYYNESNVASYSHGVRLAEYNAKQKGFAADVGLGGTRSTELRAGVDISDLSTALTTGTGEQPKLQGRFSLARVRWVYEGQDSGLIPRNGLRTELEGQWVFDSPSNVSAYPVMSGTVGYARPVNENWSFLSYFSAGSKSNRAEKFPAFMLGGSARLSSLSRNQLLGNRYYFGTGGMLRSLGKPTMFGRFYAAGMGEVGNAWYTPQTAKPYLAATVGLAGETLLGLIYTGFSVGDKGEHKIFFRLGRIF